MILPDVNPLIYAFRSETQHHEIARRWLVSTLSGPSAFGLSPLVLADVVRITTTRNIYREPSSPDDAFRFCDYLLAHPNRQIIEPGDRHWRLFKDLCILTDTRGPRITDAWYAALAIEWDCEWITFDSDFAKFPGLRWRIPGTT